LKISLSRFFTKFERQIVKNKLSEVEMRGYMYILLCSNGKYYTGSTKNLERRIFDHNNGEGANFTRKHLPVQLIYFEEFARIDDAFYREKQVQGWSRKKKEALINGDQKKLPDLSRNYSQYGPSTGFRQAQGPEQRQNQGPEQQRQLKAKRR